MKFRERDQSGRIGRVIDWLGAMSGEEYFLVRIYGIFPKEGRSFSCGCDARVAVAMISRHLIIKRRPTVQNPGDRF